MGNRTRLAGLVSLFLCTAASPSVHAAPATLIQMNGPQQGSSFFGAWCAQGDPNKHASISGNGVFLNLTNENGDTSIGNLQGSNQIQAPQWQFVTGTLSNDGSQINWSNGTYWARCENDDGGGGGIRWPNLTGTWFANGDRSRSCSIRQRHGRLSLQNESGQGANGNFNDSRHISTNWSGTTIQGRIRQHDNRIDWDNGTYWIRFRVY